MSSWKNLLLKIGDNCPEYGNSDDLKDHIVRSYSPFAFTFSIFFFIFLFLSCQKPYLGVSFSVAGMCSARVFDSLFLKLAFAGNMLRRNSARTRALFWRCSTCKPKFLKLLYPLVLFFRKLEDELKFDCTLVLVCYWRFQFFHLVSLFPVLWIVLLNNIIIFYTLHVGSILLIVLNKFHTRFLYMGHW